MRTWHQRVGPVATVRVHPSPEVVDTLVRPWVTRSAAGNQVAAERAPGIEPADLRSYQPGDRPRDIHWRATARRGELWVQERHPERATEVVVFLDSFSTGGFERAVRVAAALVDAHLARPRPGGRRELRRHRVVGPARERAVSSGCGSSTTCSVARCGAARCGRASAWCRRARCRPGRSSSRSRRSRTTARWRASLDLRNRGIDVAILEVAPTLPASAADPSSPAGAAVAHPPPGRPRPVPPARASPWWSGPRTGRWSPCWPRPKRSVGAGAGWSGERGAHRPGRGRLRVRGSGWRAVAGHPIRRARGLPRRAGRGLAPALRRGRGRAVDGARRRSGWAGSGSPRWRGTCAPTTPRS